MTTDEVDAESVVADTESSEVVLEADRAAATPPGNTNASASAIPTSRVDRAVIGR
jgi:hypothetical protein